MKGRKSNSRQQTRKQFLNDTQRVLLLTQGIAQEKRVKGEGGTPQVTRNSKCQLNKSLDTKLVPFLMEHLMDWQYINIGLSGTDKADEVRVKLGKEVGALGFFLRTWLNDEDMGKLVRYLLIANVVSLDERKESHYVNPKVILPVLKEYLGMLELSYLGPLIDAPNEGQQQAISGIDKALDVIGKKDLVVNPEIVNMRMVEDDLRADYIQRTYPRKKESEDCVWTSQEQKRYHTLLTQLMEINLPGVKREVVLTLSYRVNIPRHIIWAFIERQSPSISSRYIPKESLSIRDLIESLASELSKIRFALFQEQHSVDDEYTSDWVLRPWIIPGFSATGLHHSAASSYDAGVYMLRRKVTTPKELFHFYGKFEYPHYHGHRLHSPDDILLSSELQFDPLVFGPISLSSMVEKIRSSSRRGGIWTKYYEALGEMENRDLLKRTEDQVSLTEKGLRVAREGAYFRFISYHLSYGLDYSSKQPSLS